MMTRSNQLFLQVFILLSNLHYFSLLLFFPTFLCGGKSILEVPSYLDHLNRYKGRKCLFEWLSLCGVCHDGWYCQEGGICIEQAPSFPWSPKGMQEWRRALDSLHRSRCVWFNLLAWSRYRYCDQSKSELKESGTPFWCQIRPAVPQIGKEAERACWGMLSQLETSLRNSLYGLLLGWNWSIHFGVVKKSFWLFIFSSYS